jgi:hypothetical protein
VLEDRGWRIHRIWSTDWFRQPQEQLRRVVAAIEDALTSRSKPESPSLPVAERNIKTVEIDRVATAKTGRPTTDENSLAVPYQVANFRVKTDVPIHELPTGELARIAAQVVQTEGPVHLDEVTRRIATLRACKRTGSRIADAIESALVAATQSRLVKRDGCFYQPVDLSSTPIRDRANVESAGLMKTEYLRPAEIRAAATSRFKNRHLLRFRGYSVNLCRFVTVGGAGACRMNRGRDLLSLSDGGLYGRFRFQRACVLHCDQLSPLTKGSNHVRRK